MAKQVAETLSQRVLDRIGRRRWALAASAVYVVVGLVYVFGWGSIAHHTPSQWISPQDLWITYYASSLLAHGHVGAIYRTDVSFVEFPGILVALAPLGALSSSLTTTVLQVTGNQTAPAQGISLRAANIPFLNAQKFHLAGATYVTHPQWVILVVPYVLVLSCTALFACDALAERLHVTGPRRAALCAAEAVLLWNVTLWWGHPEDAVAVAFALYALVLALDGRYAGAGWLMGAAIAFQPLVLLMLPVLLAMAGLRRGVGLSVRAAVPAFVLLLGPLIANPRATLHALIDQPSSPILNRTTPWTALSPGLGGHGGALDVAAGPIRLIAIALAIGLGFYVARRWLERPEMIVWACALALALRSYTESVMTDYYAWAAVAVAAVVATRASIQRFSMAVGLAVATTIVAQWHLTWLPWWALQMAGLTGLLVVTSRPRPLGVERIGSRPAASRVAPTRPARARLAPAPATAGGGPRPQTVGDRPRRGDRSRSTPSGGGTASRTSSRSRKPSAGSSRTASASPPRGGGAPARGKGRPSR